LPRPSSALYSRILSIVLADDLLAVFGLLCCLLAASDNVDFEGFGSSRTEVHDETDEDDGERNELRKREERSVDAFVERTRKKRQQLT